ncbi:FUSC family protein [Streptomyces olivaceus]|uniref:FUSC family protein n=1 Tax=Streptomyces TaxID=1883 RepID=UPI0018A882F8|nr:MULTISPECIES: FUSC family protein [Streptomyces]MBF8170137.1 FUSC family protein [Streptomyces olivaceus]MBZ6136254.1 FUSC family protein [Streptomyces olivaceus]MBZ6163748.1 FUSC family protein [Streptomyces olivaceus]MBZ6227336.1 FUSC family protein [Streptomyces olivaceus]MBZ6247195.1 FUSC family protein [Streptomyces olivaceus]
MRDVRDLREAVRSALRRVKWLSDPVVAQALRSAAAASIAYVIAVRLTPDKSAAPLTAPLTALLVVQVTLYATLKMSFRRVNAVVAGVLVAIAFSQLVGLSWWSLGLLIVAALGVGHLVRAHEFTAEVAISAMLVLGVTSHGSLAWARVVETLIGATVGLAFNLFLAPPVWLEQAGESVVGLARQVRQLLLRMGEEAAGSTAFHEAAARLHEARRLDHDIGEVDEDLRQAEDSLRFNPRVREGLLHRVVLRTGLDTLEICTVVMRVLARSFTDLAKEREPEPLFPAETGATIQQLLSEIADAVVSFSVLVTTNASGDAESAEERLATELRQAAVTRDRLDELLLAEVRRDSRQWQLQGAVLAEVNRIIDEMDTEHRSRRLLEELDRHTREQRERMPRLTRLRDRVRGLFRRRNRGAAARRSS